MKILNFSRTLAVLTALVCVSGIQAFAGEVELQPGTTITLQASESTLVRCGVAEDQFLERCTIKAGINGYKNVLIGA